jgi:tight adherence protein B
MTIRDRGRRWRRRSLGIVLVAAAVALLAAPATAADAPPPAPRLIVRRVNATDPKNVIVTFTYEGAATDLSQLAMTENGKAVHPSAPAAPDNLAAGGGTATVLVIDASESAKLMLDDFKASAQAFIQGTQGSGLVGIVSTNKLSTLQTGLTADPARLTAAVNAITANGEGGLWAGIESALSTLRDHPELVPNILVLTDGNGASAAAADPSVVADVVDSEAAFFAIAVDTGHLDGPALQGLADRTGGGFVTVASPKELGQPVAQVSTSVAGTYDVAYASNAAEGLNSLTLDAGASAARVSYVSGSATNGAQSLVYVEPKSTGGFLHVQYFREHGKTLGLLLAIVAAMLAAYAVGMIFVRDNSGLSAVLRPYSEGYAQPDDDEGGDPQTGAAQTAFIQRAVELTGQFAERQGFLTTVEGKLERANLPLRAAEALFFYGASTLVVGLLVLVLSRNPLIALIVLGSLVLLPPAVLNNLASRRKKQFQAQLPDMLQLLSGTLRAGYSMMQGVEAVSQEVAEPMGRELRRVCTEARLGRPLEESLDAVADRMASADFAWAVMAIRIQREVGGNLSELLLTVAETMTQRERLRRDINSLTAEGKVSAYVLGVLPIALGFAMYVINPEYMSVLLHETTGHLLLLGGVLLMAAGFAWMWKLIQIEV